MMSYRLPQDSPTLNSRATWTKLTLAALIVTLLLLMWKYDSVLDWALNRPRGTDALFHLTDAECEGMMERALDQGADVNGRNNLGYTPLSTAVNGGELLVARSLLKHGADPNLETQFGMTPMHFAVARDDVPMLRLLISAGGSTTRPCGDETPLEVARRFDCPHVIPLLCGKR
jgi:ankyrin repeat protein